MESSLTLVSSHPQARPLNVLRDLLGVADLIELCFSNPGWDGQVHVDQMRRNARDARFLQLAPRLADSLALPLSGFVWEEQGHIVGNVSLIPFSLEKKKVFVIANVATHPDFRGRGIARALMELAMERARSRGAQSLILSVREENQQAVSLYRSLGFERITTQVTWTSTPGGHAPVGPANNFKIARPNAKDWKKQQVWLSRNYPVETMFTQQVKWNLFAPGLWAWLQRIVAETEIIQWAARKRGHLAGVVTCERNLGSKDRLWAAFPEQADSQVVAALLLHARRMISYSRGLSLVHPAGELDDAFRTAGFIEKIRLLWMKAPGVQPR